MLLLCIIYHLNNMLEKVTENEIKSFMSFLEKNDPEIHQSIIKPNRPLGYTLKELEENSFLIIEGDCLKLNADKVKSEKDLMYWENFGERIKTAYEAYKLTKMS